MQMYKTRIITVIFCKCFDGSINKAKKCLGGWVTGETRYQVGGWCRGKECESRQRERDKKITLGRENGRCKEREVLRNMGYLAIREWLIKAEQRAVSLEMQFGANL